MPTQERSAMISHHWVKEILALLLFLLDQLIHPVERLHIPNTALYYGTAQLQGNKCSRVARAYHACHSHISRVLPICVYAVQQFISIAALVYKLPVS